MKTISFFKEKFSKPSPILYKYKGCPLNSLASRDFNKAYDITVTENINECRELSFSIPITKDKKLDYNSNELMIFFDEVFYIIKEIDSDLNAYVMNVTCQELSTTLKNTYCETISQIGQTAQTIFNSIISATGYTSIGFQWLGTDIPNTTLRHLIADSEVSVYENIVNLAKNFNSSVEFSYDVQGIGYVFIRSQSIDTHKFIKKNIDIKSLSITSSSSEIYTRLFPTGSTSEDGIVLDIQSVNGGKSILEDTSYYKSIGIPDDVIANNPQYRQIKTISDDTYTDAPSLLAYAKEELSKYSKPQFSAECQIEDLSVYTDSPIEMPRINMSVKIIDKNIGFVFDCLITGIERNYNNPLETKLTISNIIPYSTSFQSLQATTTTVSRIITTTNGSPTVNVSYASGNLNALNTSLTGSVDLTTQSDKQSTLAILFEDKRIGYPTYGAMGFGTKGLCIANTLKVDGTWDWKTFGTSSGFNASLVKTGILSTNNGQISIDLLNNSFNFLNKLYSNNGLINVPTQLLTTNDKQIANTEFVTNKLNERQNVIVGTMTNAITIGNESIDLTITGLGINPIVVTNGDYSINTAQILGVKNLSTDIVTVYYTNAIGGNCKFNFTYSK